ncbi:GntR family transcriptional regulator [Saccharopolyspora sp. WRP15-2]|uniref:GntR family transcriptional regulator n=1 Tax=Saccharopolyspora oryzae TaxID=2997343 RepID=A0ABT4UTQ3_9PSEU|nr:GntR family transcriptional regulator [Saccharopolyspora oryzae]MDA3625105.1 GntR family transcriptional regulator [Saccharopolyspora oryzae]
MPLGSRDRPLRDQVCEEIRNRIIDGRFAPGDRIVERELAEELAVSRVPVREALRTLRVEGFVEDVARRGVIVRRLDRRDVEELFDVREALEGMACRLATAKADARGLRALQRHLNRADKALRNDDLTAVGKANADFHDEIVQLADHHLLAGMLEPLQGRLHWLFQQVEDPKALCEEHTHLYEAIASGDPDRAAAEAIRHVNHNREVARHLLFPEA